jgi:uncharacterized protein (UPF0371 family)
MSRFANDEIGYDGEAYSQAQLRALLERMKQFSGKLYVEVGGKFLYDGHASRVLPGFNPRCKLQLFQAVNREYYLKKLNSELSECDLDVDVETALEVILCVNARDIVAKRVWSDGGKTYIDTLWEHLSAYKTAGISRNPLIAINICSRTPTEEETRMLDTLTAELETKGYQAFRRYEIPGYPHDTGVVVSDRGYGADDWINVRPGGLTIVTSLGSSCGKMSTCLGQMYLHSKHPTNSSDGDVGYCKYELFPIHNLPLKHPINLAYEAATADIHDKNMVDPWHLAAYGVESINYNRDVEAWPILAALIEALAVGISSGNSSVMAGMLSYKSPTDMGVNMAAAGIIDDDICCRAAIQEIYRRITEYERLVPGEIPGEDASDETKKFYEEKIAVVETCRAILIEAQACSTEQVK